MAIGSDQRGAPPGASDGEVCHLKLEPVVFARVHDGTSQPTRVAAYVPRSFIGLICFVHVFNFYFDQFSSNQICVFFWSIFYIFYCCLVESCFINLFVFFFFLHRGSFVLNHG